MLKRILVTIIIFVIFVSCHGCSTPPPKHKNNVCKIFREYPQWYWAAKKTRKKWHIPISVQMAILYQESRFQDKVKPKRSKLLGIIPWKHPTSAEGYTQAINSTWQHYKESTKNKFANRQSFTYATDFIGWYAKRAYLRANIKPYDSYALYLAYHEGIAGYMRQTQQHKKWLLKIAMQVAERSLMYRNQLLQCERKLPKQPWWRKII